MNKNGRTQTRSPWAAIAHRHDIHVFLRPLPPGTRGYCQRTDGQWIVLLDITLDRPGRSAALAHELEHIRTGIMCPPDWMPDGWSAVAARNEARIQHTVATQLVDPASLDTWLRRRLTIDQPTTALDVSIDFEVPADIARIALEEARARWHAAEVLEHDRPAVCVSVRHLPPETAAALGRALAGVLDRTVAVDPDARARIGPS